uniref:Uncharacterized protein n=1 Tax=Anguilla anguilla TaxID=7936 RepID=A0A0E9TSU5_ANGAN
MPHTSLTWIPMNVHNGLQQIIQAVRYLSLRSFHNKGSQELFLLTE